MMGPVRPMRPLQPVHTFRHLEAMSPGLHVSNIRVMLLRIQEESEFRQATRVLST